MKVKLMEYMLCIFTFGIHLCYSLEYWNGNEYYFSQKSPEDLRLTYSEAQAYCQQLGFTLASVTSQQEQNFVISILASTTSYSTCWFGLYYPHDSVELCDTCDDCADNRQDENSCTLCQNCRSQWQWTDGSQVGFENWNAYQPNENVKCGNIFEDGWWYDTECHLKRCFICKSAGVPEEEMTETVKETTTLHTIKKTVTINISQTVPITEGKETTVITGDTTGLTTSGLTDMTGLVTSGLTDQTGLKISGLTDQTSLATSGLTDQTNLAVSGLTDQTNEITDEGKFTTPVITEFTTPVITEFTTPVITEFTTPVITEFTTPVITEDVSTKITRNIMSTVTEDISTPENPIDSIRDIITGAVICALVLVIAVLIGVICCRFRKRQQKNNPQNENEALHSGHHALHPHEPEIIMDHVISFEQDENQSNSETGESVADINMININESETPNDEGRYEALENWMAPPPSVYTELF